MTAPVQTPAPDNAAATPAPLAPVDPVILAIQEQMRVAGCAAADPTALALDAARAQQQRQFGFINRDVPTIAGTEELRLRTRAGWLRARLYRPADAAGDFFVVFLRGAGWWAGDLDSHEGVCRATANALGRCVVALDYRRSPEHRFPAQRDDATDAITALLAQAAELGLPAERVVLWGESAGASLAVLAWDRLRAAGRAAPVTALVLFYGNLGGPRAGLRKQSQWVWRQYLGEAACASPPAAAVPMNVAVQGLPPVWLGVGDADPLIEDSQAFAARLAAGGAHHRLHVYPGMPHGFSVFPQQSAVARGALDDAARFAREVAGGAR